MDIWIPITIAAALAQTLRFMLQKQLGAGVLSTTGATFARFLYSAPLVVCLAYGYSRISGQPVPVPSGAFWIYALSGGAAQIFATLCVVALFKSRNFAVGITFKKTEVLMSVLVGVVVLGEGVTGLGLLAILLGLGGVLLLSDTPAAAGGFLRRIANRAAGLGLASGLFFAISGVGYRAASLSLESGDAFQRAIVTLACVTVAQVAAMTLWMAWREAGQIGRVVAAWRVAGLVGLSSMVGSICWFTAFTLQTVAYVNAVGQVELIFSLVIGALVFSEKISRREWQGLALLAASILMLVLVT